MGNFIVGFLFTILLATVLRGFLNLFLPGLGLGDASFMESWILVMIVLIMGADAEGDRMNELTQAFSELVRSSHDLIDRFGVTPDPVAQFEKFCEEVVEFAEEFPFGLNKAEEGVDVLVTLLNVLRAHNVSLEEIAHAMQQVAAKNDAKTSVTHEVVNGRIERKGRYSGTQQ